MTERTRNRQASKTSNWKTTALTQSANHGAAIADPVIAEGSYTSYLKTEVMTDVVTPEYKKLSGQGQIVNSPMTKTIVITRDNLCKLSEIYSWDFDCTSCTDVHTYTNSLEGTSPSSTKLNTGDLPAAPSYDYQTLIDQAVNKAWARCDVTDIQSAVMVAESKKTVVSLASIFTRLIKIMKSIKRLNAQELSRQLSAKEMSDRYMELRYAIRPLMYDARGVINAVTTRAGESKKRLTFRGYETDFDEDVDQDVVEDNYTSFFNKNFGTVHTTITELEHKVEVRAGVLTALEELNALSTWGVTQPIESLWELVPFSFIVDWFFNIGDTIAAWTPNYGLKALSSWYTIEETVYQYVGLSSSGWFDSGWDGNYKFSDFRHELSDCWYDITTISKTRVPNPRRTILPTFNLSVDAFKLTDLVIIAKKIWR